MYEYEGLSTYPVYQEQLDKILSSVSDGLRKVIIEDNQLYGSLITTMMLADWRFDSSKQVKQSTFRIASLKFKLRNILNSRRVLTRNKLLHIAENTPKKKEKIEIFDIQELAQKPRYNIMIKYIEGYSLKELSQMFNIQYNKTFKILKQLARELADGV